MKAQKPLAWNNHILANIIWWVKDLKVPDGPYMCPKCSVDLRLYIPTQNCSLKVLQKFTYFWNNHKCNDQKNIIHSPCCFFLMLKHPLVAQPLCPNMSKLSSSGSHSSKFIKPSKSLSPNLTRIGDESTKVPFIYNQFISKVGCHPAVWQKNLRAGLIEALRAHLLWRPRIWMISSSIWSIKNRVQKRHFKNDNIMQYWYI